LVVREENYGEQEAAERGAEYGGGITGGLCAARTNSPARHEGDPALVSVPRHGGGICGDVALRVRGAFSSHGSGERSEHRW